VFRRTTIPAVLAALALTASAACSGGAADKGSAGANPTLATDPPRTTTTDPYAVPAVIDAAYVNRVLAGLDAALGDVFRIVRRTNTIPPEAYAELKALYSDPDFMQIRIDGYQLDIRNGFRNYKPDPGNRSSSVIRLINVRQTCIFVQVSRDYTAVGLNPAAELQTQWVALRPLDRSRDPNGYNPTPWALAYDGFPPDRSQPPDPCALS
jgi:hypothetical protein